MSLTRPPQLGNVVWVEVADANGFCKRRPAVVVSATATIAAGHPIRVVAITTRLPTPLPDDHVLLPWERQGEARLGLRRPCAAVTSWLVEVLLADVEECVGLLPAVVVAEIVAKLQAAAPSGKPPGEVGGTS